MRTRNPVTPGGRLGMQLDAWPASDQAGWNEAFAPPDPFNLRPNGAELRATSRLAIAPQSRATQERVISYLHDLHDEITIVACMAMLAASNGLSN